MGLVGSAGRGGELAKRLRLGHDSLLPKGVTLRKDVLPHLGDHAAAFLLGGDPAKPGTTTAAKTVDGGLVAEVKDAAALRKAVGTGGRTVDVGGQTIRLQGDRAVWIGDRVAAIGTEPAVRAVIAAAGGADLAGNPRFTGALDQLRTTDPVGVAWVDLQQAPALNAAVTQVVSRHARLGGSSKARAEALGALPKDLRSRLQGAGRRSAKGLSGFRLRLPASDATTAIALELRPGTLVVRSGGTGRSSTADLKAASDAVAALPAGSWAAFAGGTGGLAAGGGSNVLDGLAKRFGVSFPSELRKALEGVQLVSGGVQGKSVFDARAAAVVRAKDEAGASVLLKQLGDALGGIGGKTGLSAKPTSIPGASSGVVIGLPGLPLQLAAGVQGDRLAIGLGAESVTKALATDGKRFSSDPLYAQAQEALGGAAPSFVLQPKPLTDLLSTLGPLLGGGGGGGLGALFGGGSAKGGASKHGSGAGGLGSFLGGGGLAKITDVLGRVKLATASKESTGASTWRGSFVVQYDGTPKAKQAAPKTP